MLPSRQRGSWEVSLNCGHSKDGWVVGWPQRVRTRLVEGLALEIGGGCSWKRMERARATYFRKCLRSWQG